MKAIFAFIVLLLVFLIIGVTWETAGAAKEREIENKLVIACEQDGSFAIGTSSFDCEEEN